MIVVLFTTNKYYYYFFLRIFPICSLAYIVLSMSNLLAPKSHMEEDTESHGRNTFSHGNPENILLTNSSKVAT